MTRPAFEPFPKIPRLRRDIIITEKIDGTNAQIVVTAEGEVYAGSRNRWITPENDSAGFAAWVNAHEEELRTGLGIGQHFGEWWGAGIGRKYGLKTKHFSLFNSHRWKDGLRPVCCGVVPTLYVGPYSDSVIEASLEKLRTEGSQTPDAKGFTPAEGVVVYMTASATMYKVLCENDQLPKGLVTYGERIAAEAAGGLAMTSDTGQAQT